MNNTPPEVIEKCAICGEGFDYESFFMYDGDKCHRRCAFDDMDSIVMDLDFSDN